MYFCTLAGEIDVGELKDHLLASSHDCAWRSQQAGDALILVRALLCSDALCSDAVFSVLCVM